MQLETHHCALVLCLLTPFCGAQDTSTAQPQPGSQAPAPAAASPLPTPAITGPLKRAPPIVIDAET